MNLNFEVSLDDIGTGLDLSGHSESERQEVMDFLVSVDENTADFDFSRELIYRLAENFTHDSEGYGYKNVALKGEQSGVTSLYKRLSSLAEDLSYVDEEHLIVLMADAIFRKREREAKARRRAVEEAVRRTEQLEKEAAEPCVVCAHPNGVHNHQCELSRKGACHACMEADKKEDPPCTRCGCPRELHRVNVGGERTGCFDHISCDEWRQDKPKPLTTVCGKTGCGHPSHLHFGKQGFKEDTCTECSCLSYKEEA